MPSMKKIKATTIKTYFHTKSTFSHYTKKDGFMQPIFGNSGSPPILLLEIGNQAEKEFPIRTNYS
jgi:hypothetical protein